MMYFYLNSKWVSNRNFTVKVLKFCHLNFNDKWNHSFLKLKLLIYSLSFFQQRLLCNVQMFIMQIYLICFNTVILWYVLISIIFFFQTISGLRLTDNFLKRTYEHDELAQVFIYNDSNAWWYLFVWTKGPNTYNQALHGAVRN